MKIYSCCLLHSQGDVNIGTWVKVEIYDGDKAEVVAPTYEMDKWLNIINGNAGQIVRLLSYD